MSDPSEEVPSSLSDIYTSAVARQVGQIFSDQVIFPEVVRMDRPDDLGRWFSGWPGPVVVVLVENQGVCAWGVPLAPHEPVVLVGGGIKLRSGSVRGFTVYSASVEGFIEGRLWDGETLSRKPCVGAQSDELGEVGLRFLGARFQERASSSGWPGHTVHRFENESTRILLWNRKGECDWWVSDPDPEVLYRVLLGLRDQFGLVGIISTDTAGRDVIQRLRF